MRRPDGVPINRKRGFQCVELSRRSRSRYQRVLGQVAVTRATEEFVICKWHGITAGLVESHAHVRCQILPQEGAGLLDCDLFVRREVSDESGLDGSHVLRGSKGVIAKQAGEGCGLFQDPSPGRGVRVPSAQRPSRHALHHCIYWHCPRTRLRKLMCPDYRSAIQKVST